MSIVYVAHIFHIAIYIIVTIFLQFLQIQNHEIRMQGISRPGYVFSMHNRWNLEDILYILFYILYITVRFTKNDRLAGSGQKNAMIKLNDIL